MAENKANGVKLDKIPISFQLDDKVIDGAVVKPLTFQSFSACLADAGTVVGPKSFEAKVRRIRLVRQVDYYVNGSLVAVGPNDVIKIPIPAARLLAAELDKGEGPAGKIIRDGDGIDKSIVYELGTPIPMGQGKPPLTELEFHARYYGEIEDIMSAADSIQQTMLLIETIAKPIGGTLTALPSWALSQIKIGDGVTISRLILPRFLGSPDE